MAEQQIELLSPGHSMCAGCGIGTALNLLSRAVTKDTIVCSATCCAEVTTSAYPLTAWNVPWIHSAFETTSAMASGVEAAVKKLGRKCKVLAVAGDGGTYDIGFQGMSGMFERGHKVTQICMDNEAYMNTGIQRSGGTPHGAWTTTSPNGTVSSGKPQWKKPIVDIVAAHRIPYAATASVGYPMDFVAKIKKALENQPSFVVVHCNCPPGWKIDNSKGPKIAKLAVDTGVNPLYEIENGQLKLSRPLNDRKPVAEYLKLQGRFKHLNEKEISEIQKHVDGKCEELEAREKSGLKFFF